MAPCLRAVSQLVLLVLFSCVPMLPVQCLCGSNLLCGEIGFFDPTSNSWDRKMRQRNTSVMASEMKVRRGIIEQCCHKPCSIYDLQNYCN
ncbi:LOW QUALITY PROTEIN: insulin-like [Megalops cyprinoides]|uniref:LOW QUALITY PROTEIN: insulin-like n=1 Tax=Megalops cyprinoides TaxID=118141 RepID=UPI00186477AE|nr:LOW QUALITY PROTEIN: insulin-like [Megalops cyprinoides]